MKEIFERLLERQSNHEACMLVSAVGGEGSVPRKTQAHMLVDAGGRICGTVGGGAVEGNGIVLAQRLLAQGKCGLREYELHEQASEDIGMICGGRVTLHFLCIAPENHQIQTIAQKVLELDALGVDAWLVIRLGSGALSLYAQGEVIGMPVPKEVCEALAAGARQIGVQDEVYYVDHIISSGRVYVFGGGHVAQALVPVLTSVGFRCVVIEDREEFCSRTLFPLAENVCLMQANEWVKALEIGAQDCICIMTRGHKNDLECQAFALGTKAGYIGVIGSRRKIAAVNRQLMDRGFTDEDIARIITPIGLEIGAITPAEIAISIAAQMIMHRAKQRTEPIKTC